MTDRFTDLDRPGLDASALRAALTGERGHYGRFDLLERTGSTNVDLIARAAAEPEHYPDLSVLTTEYQAAGRGRLDRVWTAPARSSLFVSVLLRPPSTMPVSAYSWLSLLAALALTDSLREQAKLPAGIKWPNDILIEDRKVAGVLAQFLPGPAPRDARSAGRGHDAAELGQSRGDASAGPAVVVGMGLNVSLGESELPLESATSLLLAGAETTDRSVLLKAYLRSLARYYQQFCARDGDSAADLGPHGSLHRIVSARMVTIGQRVRAELPGGRTITGAAAGLDGSGALLITGDDGGRQAVSAGDVVHLRPAA